MEPIKNHSEEVIKRLPFHLKQFIVPQDYEQYTPINQAVWRYVMRKNIVRLKDVAHESYIEGLKKTGIDVNSIPSIYGMNRILRCQRGVNGRPPSPFRQIRRMEDCDAPLQAGYSSRINNLVVPQQKHHIWQLSWKGMIRRHEPVDIPDI